MRWAWLIDGLVYGINVRNARKRFEMRILSKIALHGINTLRRTKLREAAKQGRTQLTRQRRTKVALKKRRTARGKSRNHEKKQMTRDKEAMLYLQCAEKYLAMAINTMPSTWARREFMTRIRLQALIEERVSWNYRRNRYDIVSKQDMIAIEKRTKRALVKFKIKE